MGKLPDSPEVQEKVRRAFKALWWKLLVALVVFLVVMGIVIEHQDWGRGWAHDAYWAVRVRLESEEAREVRLAAFELEAATWYEGVADRHPRLAFEWNEIAKNENGLLASYRLCQELEADPDWAATVDELDEFRAWLEPEEGDPLVEREEEDRLKLDAFFGSREPTIARLIRIGQMDRASHRGLPVLGFEEIVPVAQYKHISDFLTLAAVSEAWSGRPEESLVRLKAAKKISQHSLHAELPSLIEASLSTATFLGVQTSAYDVIRPLMGESAWNEEWVELVRQPLAFGGAWESYWRGEFHALHRSGDMVREIGSLCLRDWEAFFETRATNMHWWSNPTNMASWDSRRSTEGLTFRSASLMAMTAIGTDSYSAGMLRAFSQMKQYEIAARLHWLSLQGVTGKGLADAISPGDLEVFPGYAVEIDYIGHRVGGPIRLEKRLSLLEF